MGICVCVLYCTRWEAPLENTAISVFRSACRLISADVEDTEKPTGFQ